jgi:hypothetical protein
VEAGEKDYSGVWILAMLASCYFNRCNIPSGHGVYLGFPEFEAHVAITLELMTAVAI